MGLRLYFGSTLPLGRPRWLIRITAAPWSRRYWIVGSDARRRVSSVIAPVASCGALRSTRTSARLPRTSRSRTVAFSILEPLSDEAGQVADAARVAPLVVVPRDDLHHVAEGDGIQP